MSMMIQGKAFGVTGGSGFVGRRLVEMLVERGASRVVSLDIREPLIRKYPGKVTLLLYDHLSTLYFCDAV
jgi:nucleoside-diphosphate-sugar epimerase